MALRFPRPVMLTAVIGLAMAWTAVGSVPALADQVRQQQWWLGALHVTQAQRISTGSGVTIALLDTGVDPAQPDLAGSVITGPDFTNSGEKLGQPFFGVHGTAMASLIVGHGHGAGGENGVLGVAPGARLLSVRVNLDDGDPLTTEPGVVAGLPAAIAAGIRYAVSSGAQVIDLPLDPGQSTSALVASTAPAPAPGTPLTAVQAAEQAAAGGSAAEQAAVSFALRKGVVLVAPAGDNGAGTDEANFPASYPGVISVGAFDSTITKAPFTNQQSYVTLTAAGSGMTAATPTGYATVSTTAAASAVVTGIAALIKSQYPELTPAQVSQALTSSTVFRPPGGQANGSGHGTADAAAALKAAAAIAKPPPPRAGARAVPRTLPAAPSVPFIDKSLGRTLLRDALISLAVLIVLLLAIAVYALVRRRRRRARTPARADRELGARSAYAPGNGSSHADEMVEYFAAMPAEPSGTRAARSPEGAAPSRAFGDTYPGAGQGGTAGRLPVTPMTWAHAPRSTTKVSGSPPWEPASKPDSELPWTASLPGVSPPSAPARPGPAATTGGPAPGEAAWIFHHPEADRRKPAGDDAPEPARPAENGVPADKNGPADQDGPAGENQPADNNGPAGENQPADQDGEPDSGPIYVWNPGASTESFPIVPRDG